MAIATDKKITNKEFDNFTDSFALDLTAFFGALRDDVNKLLIKAKREHWTPERLIKEVEKII